MIGLNLLYLAGGIVVVETLFAFPGIGQGLFIAVDDRDIPVIQLTVLLLAAFYVLCQHRLPTWYRCSRARGAGCRGHDPRRTRAVSGLTAGRGSAVRQWTRAAGGGRTSRGASGSASH